MLFRSYIRSVEHKHFYKHGESVKHYKKEDAIETSVVTFDYPVLYKENPDPLYPIRDNINSSIYNKYNSIKPNHVIFGGRLAEYKYLDLDQSMASAISKFNNLMETKQ